MTNSVVKAVAKELLKPGLQGGVDDDCPLRETVYRSPMAETQSGIPGSGEAPMKDEMETLQRVPIKGNT